MGIYKMDGLQKSDGKLFSAIPAGEYPVRIVNIEEKKSGDSAKNPGRPYLNFKSMIIDGEHQGQMLFWIITPPADGMKPEELRINISKMKRVVMATDLPIPASEEIDMSELIGQELKVLVTVKTVEGEERNEVKDWLRL